MLSISFTSKIHSEERDPDPNRTNCSLTRSLHFEVLWKQNKDSSDVTNDCSTDRFTVVTEVTGSPLMHQDATYNIDLANNDDTETDVESDAAADNTTDNKDDDSDAIFVFCGR